MLSKQKQLDQLIIKTLAKEMLGELNNNIIPFWMLNALDMENGGCYGNISNDLTVDYKADKGGILTSRVLWFFSAAYRTLGGMNYLESAGHAYEFFKRYFWDFQYGGVFWMVGYDGEIKNDRKHAYAMAFAIYGLSEYYRASGNSEALEMAKEIFNILENKFRDLKNGGYFEAMGRDYMPIADVRLSEKDRNEIKSMNTHLHLLEAYTNLMRVWDNEGLRTAHKQLLTVVLDRIVDPLNHRFLLFFNENWECSSQIVSYGHDIEGSWLLCEAADIQGDKPLRKRTYDTAVSMAYEVLRNGIDNDYGGIFYEKEMDVLDSDKHWWPQAEAVVGFLNSYTITGDEVFLETACKVWSFIKNHIVDREYGEWYWRCDRTGEPYLGEPKADPWKGPYHNGRACMEVYERYSRMKIT